MSVMKYPLNVLYIFDLLNIDNSLIYCTHFSTIITYPLLIVDITKAICYPIASYVITTEKSNKIGRGQSFQKAKDSYL